MPYVCINKETKETLIFGSIIRMCEDTGLKKDRMYTVFGRKQQKELETDKYRIVKTELQRSKK